MPFVDLYEYFHRNISIRVYIRVEGSGEETALFLCLSAAERQMQKQTNKQKRQQQPQHQHHKTTNTTILNNENFILYFARIYLGYQGIAVFKCIYLCAK